MSQPNLPNITPNITLTRDDAVNLVLSSIAMEEMGLSHILNAEGEKLQYVLGTLPGLSGPAPTISDILTVNSSVKDMVNAITKNEYVLQQKLEAVTNIPLSVGPPGPAGVTGPTGELIIGEPLFTITDSSNSSATVAYGDTIEYTSSTLDISVTQNAVNSVVTIENPQIPGPVGFQELGGYYYDGNFGPVNMNENIPLPTPAQANRMISSDGSQVILSPGTYSISYSLLASSSAVVELRQNGISINATKIAANVGTTASNTIIFEITAPNTLIGLWSITSNPIDEILYANIIATRVY